MAVLVQYLFILERWRLSTAEAVAASVTCWLALAAIAGYVIDAAGLGVQPWPALLVALAVTGVAALTPRAASAARVDLFAWAGIIAFTIAMLLRFLQKAV